MSCYACIRVLAAVALIGVMSVAHVDAQARAEDTQAQPEARITEFPLPTSGALPGGIVVGPDGALWFYETGSNQIGRISTEGQITEFPISTANASQPNQGFLGVGPDGAIWFTKTGASASGGSRQTDR